MANEMLGHYSRALDEIYYLRVLLARELTTNTYVQSFATTPLFARRELDEQRARIETALLRGARDALGPLRSGEAHALLQRAGAKTTLTRFAWENAQHLDAD